MSLIQRMSRVFVAMTLLTGPGPVYAMQASAPSSPNNNKEAASSPVGSAKTTGAKAQSRPKAGHFTLPLYFEANKGQIDASVKYFSHGADFNVYLTALEAVMVLPRAKADKNKTPVVVRMKIQGANAGASVRGRDMLAGHTSYFYGNDPKNWQVGVKQFAKVEYSQIYPGIDMVYYGKQGHVEHDFVVAPGADPGRILIGFDGGKGLRLDPKGDLIIGVDGGELTYQAPKLYQKRGGKRVRVAGRFELAGNRQVRFAVGAYEKSRELVIDPQIIYGTYLGGTGNDYIDAIAVDGTQEAYLTGTSNSAPSGVSGFPAATSTYPASIGSNQGANDVFVAKLSANGTTLIWLAWLGGALNDQGNGIALDKTSVATPNVYVTGVTSSPTFPVKGNPTVLQACSTLPGTTSTSLAFALELSQPANIPALVYSTCYGGTASPSQNSGNAIAVDSLGAAYVTGNTLAFPFPVSLGTPAPYNIQGSASQDVFVLKIAPAGLDVAYAMLLGVSDTITSANAIAVDAGGLAWVTGQTYSTTLPATTGHFSSLKNTNSATVSNAYVAEVNITGTALSYATYINGDVNQSGSAIAIDSGGKTPYNVFVAGWTSSDTGFPSTPYLLLPLGTGAGERGAVWQKSLVGAFNPFILRLNPFASAAIPGAAGYPDNPLEMVYASHLGATTADYANALALDDLDDAYITGYTTSSDWEPPAPLDPLTACSTPCVSVNTTPTELGSNGGTSVAFVSALGPTGLTRPFFTYLGDTIPGEVGNGIAIDALHNIYVAGSAADADFPLVNGSLDVAINDGAGAGAFDGFVVKIAPVLSFGPPLAPPEGACTISGLPNPSSGFEVGGTTLTITGTNFVSPSSGTLTINGSTLPYTLFGSTAVTVVTSSSAMSGSVPVVMETPNGANCSTTFSYIPPGLSSCTISGIVPLSGSTLGGTSVLISGANFFGVTASTDVTFGGINASTYTVNSSSTGITAISPAHPLAGFVSLSVVTSSGTCSASYDYATPGVPACTISGISPSSGFTLGGTSVTITGTGLYGFPPGGGGVTFDGNNAASYTANASSGSIVAVSPRHPLTGTLVPGPISLLVTTDHGACSATYDYLFSPTAIPGVCGEDYFFPSPATGLTASFAYCMTAPGTMTVKVYNVVGEIVAKVVNSSGAGAQIANLNTARLEPGVYLYRMDKAYAGGETDHSNVEKFVVRH